MPKKVKAKPETEAKRVLPKEDNAEIADILRRMDEMRQELDRLKTHTHLGNDGSEPFRGDTEFRGRNLELSGGGPVGGTNVTEPLTIVEGSSRNIKTQRGASMGVAIAGTKDDVSEQVSVLLGAGKLLPLEEAEGELSTANKTDWNKISGARVRVIHVPQSPGGASGPSVFPPFAFIVGERTPLFTSTGSISSGADSLVDSTADFATDAFAGALINLIAPSGAIAESYRIVSNTRNTILIDGAWASDDGIYTYVLTVPVFLGEAGTPFTRVYVGEDIRLGYGNSGGDQVVYIKMGTGSPEGVVTANIGSLYLRRDGGSGTTLYVKEAGDGLATGWSTTA